MAIMPLLKNVIRQAFCTRREFAARGVMAFADRLAAERGAKPWSRGSR